MPKLTIISRSYEPFANRYEAGFLLAAELQQFSQSDTVILGIPRGGVFVAQEMAKRLDVETDIVLAQKLGAPNNPELALGAICENGKCFLDKSLVYLTKASHEYIEREKSCELAELSRRKTLYRQVKPKIPLTHRTVIVTDDGVATGATMQAALWAVRQENPIKLIAAIPVGPEETVRNLTRHADETFCLRTPGSFEAVGRFYLNFEQLTDEQLLDALREQTRLAVGK